MIKKKYKDSNNNDRTLHEMLNIEPEWVISRFRFMENALDQIEKILKALGKKYEY